MSSSRGSNPNAKLFVSNSSFFRVILPCSTASFKIRKRGGITKIIQIVLLVGLVVTLTANLYFITDIAWKLNQEQRSYEEGYPIPFNDQRQHDKAVQKPFQLDQFTTFKNVTNSKSVEHIYILSFISSFNSVTVKCLLGRLSTLNFSKYYHYENWETGHENI